MARSIGGGAWSSQWAACRLIITRTSRFARSQTLQSKCLRHPPSLNWYGFDEFWVYIAGEKLILGQGDTTLPHENAISSTMMVTNQAGTASGDIIFGPWGNTITGGGSYADVFAGLGFQINYPLPPSATRDYNQTMGRWLVPDPAGRAAASPANPQSWNMYAYALDNPTTFNDPLGLKHERGGADCWNWSGYSVTAESPGLIHMNANWHPEAVNCSGDGDGIPILPSHLGPMPPNPAALLANLHYRISNEMLVAAEQNLTPKLALEGRVFLSTLVQNFLDEFKKGGCVNTFLKGMDQADVLSAALNGSPNIAENAINGTANSMAVSYAAERALVVPFRSSVVRGILETGETAASAFAPLYLNYQAAWGFFGKEIPAMIRGNCH